MYLSFKKFLLIIRNESLRNPFKLIAKFYLIYKRDGWRGILSRLDKKYHKLNKRVSIDLTFSSEYPDWIKNNEKDILKCNPLKFSPLISIVTPVYNTEVSYLKEMIESVLGQTYSNWELCIADDCSTITETVKILEQYEKEHTNIKIIYRKVNGHISEASNSALSIASGEYIAFLDHDDRLSPNALYEMVKKINENLTLKLIYSDEDKIDKMGNRSNPHFKSSWNPDMFFSQNYICHFVMIKKDIVDKIGGFRKGYEGSQDYDLLLRSLEYIKDYEIDRVEKILYHWRAIEGSTAYGVSEKEYAHDAGIRSLKDYFNKIDPAIKVESGKLPTTYKVVYPLRERPLVSLLVPTRDGYEILHKCIESILEKTAYTNYEIIILDNESSCKKTLKYFDKLKLYENIRILKYPYSFNYSAINNFGVKHAKGEVIGLINNDIEIIGEEWLNEMVQHALRPEIGAVGAKLYYGKEIIQHAGVILGIGGVAGHSHKYFPRDADGYFSRLKIIQNYSAVTGACLLVKKSLYEEVGGLDEENLKVAFNDVDFCLKLLEKGYRNLWTPYAEAYHHESISRGKEDTPQKLARFNSEVNYMKSRYKKRLGDDFSYNIHLTKKYENFGINIKGQV